MTPYLQDADCTLYHGDVLQVLRELPAESVDCCVTSPPYWGLRDYGTGAWEGGDEGCDHVDDKRTSESLRTKTRNFGTARGRSEDYLAREISYGQMCRKCGATRIDQQLGLEPTPEEYVTRMVEVFREVRRVLAAHGTVWLNLGDSYTGGKTGRTDQGRDIGGRGGNYGDGSFALGGQRPVPTGMKSKDLVGIPWRVAFALQTDGWYLRSDIIWAKPNPMPESVTDRPTKAHEYVFLLSKQPRYFFDQEAVREDFGPRGLQKGRLGRERNVGGRTDGLTRPGVWDNDNGNAGRNIRSVWEIATQPYPEAHFATFPEELARRCIAAGCPENGVMLDPFVGSGTVCFVARKLGRHSIGIDLNESYLALAAKRLQQQSLFAEV